MTFFKHKSAFAYSALAVATVMMAQAHAAVIQGLSATQVSADTTQLRIKFDGTPVSPTAYQQAGSNQLILDFNQVTSSGLPRNMPINRGVVNNVTALNSKNVTRLMVGLNGTANYSSSVDGDNLLINVVGQNPPSAMATPVMPAPASMVQATPVVPSTPVIPAAGEPMNVRVNPLLAPQAGSIGSSFYDGVSAINYSGNGKNGGNITVALTNEAVPVDVQRQGNKIVIRTQGATIPRHLLRQISAGGLVTGVNAVNQGQSGIITINMSGDYEYQAYQSGSSLHISVMPPKPVKAPTLEERTYTGEPLSMAFQDVSVRTVLDVLGQFTDTNIVASDNVQGNITLRLINVPWDQALDIILKSKDLDKRKNGNVILVAPAKELKDAELATLKALEEEKSLAPLRTEYIRLNYAKADDVLKLIEDARSSGSRSNDVGNASLLASSKGVITVDARTNTLIVKDTSEGINSMRALIEKIDIPVKQVMIEARIVTASETFAREIGVRWGANKGSSTNPFSLKSGSPTNLSVDLGTSKGIGGGLTVGLLSISDMLLDLSLSALKTEGRGEIISAPKVLTADKQKARISSGRQIAYQEASASGATSVSFKEAALTLEATPNITPDGKISIQLDVRNGDTTGEVYAGVPVIREDRISTNVVLEDGQTVVLGGVFRDRLENNDRKVPFLGDIPGVGRLFKYDGKTVDKSELLIFITPRLVNDGISRIN
ncbi:type IV pilus secretin PilQ [Moraxella sp. VT-16-12]|uniref:type IV pilus secretin PilQ n=1 Tax=Moraxella sp. VT-16-12 TaxID=2014877 RepID=UPI000B7CB7AE|nr:type IV pilus secretin PilQ [Moraxella sp. VT-16-12]TWV84713.1 type IV pilus secretin PilQ [Moraxella sp. VT-16-12]